MPVDDHPIHEKVRFGDDFRYGCWCLPEPILGYMAKDGVVIDFDNHKEHGVINAGRYRMKYVENAMSRKCRHPEHETDLNCRGCTRDKDIEFIAKYWRDKEAEVRQVLSHTMRSS